MNWHGNSGQGRKSSSCSYLSEGLVSSSFLWGVREPEDHTVVLVLKVHSLRFFSLNCHKNKKRSWQMSHRFFGFSDMSWRCENLIASGKPDTGWLTEMQTSSTSKCGWGQRTSSAASYADFLWVHRVGWSTLCIFFHKRHVQTVKLDFN